MPGSQCRGRTRQSKDKVFGQEGTAIFAGEYIHQNLSVMTKDQMKYALSMSGEFNLEVGYMEIAKVRKSRRQGRRKNQSPQNLEAYSE